MAREHAPSGCTGNKKGARTGAQEGDGSGGRIRTCDLRVMSPTSYRTAPPRDVGRQIVYVSTVDCKVPGRDCLHARRKGQARCSDTLLRRWSGPGRQASGMGHARRYSRRARPVCVLALAPRRPRLLPAAAPASPLRRRPARRRRAACAARSRASTTAPRCSPRSTTSRAPRSTRVNVRLQEARRDLERAQVQLDAAQALRGARLAAMYKSDGYSVLDVIFNLSDIGEADTQLGYFRSIDEADQDTVTRIAAMEQQIQALDAADRQGPGRRPGPRDGPARAAGGHRGRAGRARAAPRRPRRARQEAARAAGAAGRGRPRRAWPRPPASTWRPSPARRRRSPSSRRR